MNTKIKVGLTHLGTAMGGAIAATAFLAQHSVDLYAIWDQLNETVAAITKLVAMMTPLATGAYAVYKATVGQQLAEVAKIPEVKAVVTDTVTALNAPSDKVVSSIADIPPNARG